MARQPFGCNKVSALLAGIKELVNESINIETLHVRGTDGAQGLRMPAFRMQPAPNSHRSRSPKDAEPDDFRASPILGTLPNGKTILEAGQKTGIIWAHDPDRKCAFVWKSSVASKPAGPQGRVNFGGSANGGNAYFGPRRGASSSSSSAFGARTLRPIKTAITTVPASVKAPVAA